MNISPKNNIEDLFKSNFESFEPEVDPSVWNNIQVKLQKPVTPTSGTGSIAKIIIGSAAVGALIIGAVYLFSPNTNLNQKHPIASNLTRTINIDNKIINNTKENQNIDNQTVKNNSLPRNHKTTEGSDHMPFVTHQNNNQTNEKSPLNVTHEITTPTNNPKNEIGNVTSNPTPVTTQNNDNKNTDENTTHVNDVKYPIADIVMTPVGGYSPLTVYFNNKGTAQKCEWNFGDGMPVSTDNNTVHIYEKAGNYMVILTAYYGNAAQSDTAILEVLTPSYIPNAFSPNGDGNNDIFKFESTDLNFVEAVIYDRQGRMVAKWNSIDEGWNGINMKTGEKCAVGVYIYTVKWKTPEGKYYEQKGSVTLKE